MAVTEPDRAALAAFSTYRQSNDSPVECWDHAYAAFTHQNPGTGVTRAEFEAALRNRGALVQDVAGGGTAGHDYRLSI